MWLEELLNDPDDSLELLFEEERDDAADAVDNDDATGVVLMDEEEPHDRNTLNETKVPKVPLNENEIQRTIEPSLIDENNRREENTNKEWRTAGWCINIRWNFNNFQHIRTHTKNVQFETKPYTKLLAQICIPVCKNWDKEMGWMGEGCSKGWIMNVHQGESLQRPENPTAAQLAKALHILFS
jgi:hypothetical protein